MGPNPNQIPNHLRVSQVDRISLALLDAFEETDDYLFWTPDLPNDEGIDYGPRGVFGRESQTTEKELARSKRLQQLVLSIGNGSQSSSSDHHGGELFDAEIKLIESFHSLSTHEQEEVILKMRRVSGLPFQNVVAGRNSLSMSIPLEEQGVITLGRKSYQYDNTLNTAQTSSDENIFGPNMLRTSRTSLSDENIFSPMLNPSSGSKSVTFTDHFRRRQSLDEQKRRTRKSTTMDIMEAVMEEQNGRGKNNKISPSKKSIVVDDFDMRTSNMLNMNDLCVQNAGRLSMNGRFSAVSDLNIDMKVPSVSDLNLDMMQMDLSESSDHYRGDPSPQFPNGMY